MPNGEGCQSNGEGCQSNGEWCQPAKLRKKKKKKNNSDFVFSLALSTFHEVRQPYEQYTQEFAVLYAINIFLKDLYCLLIWKMNVFRTDRRLMLYNDESRSSNTLEDSKIRVLRQSM